MTNTFAPFGFSQSQGTGSTPTYEQVARAIASTASAMYSGDVVTSQTDGTIGVTAPGTTQIAGIFVGCEFINATTKQKNWSPYWPGSGSALSGTDITGYIINDPNAQFVVQSSGSAAVAITDVNANIQYVAGTGNTLSGRSGSYVDQGNINPATTTFPFRILSLVTNPPGANGTDSTTPYNWIRVGFNFVDTRVTTGT